MRLFASFILDSYWCLFVGFNELCTLELSVWWPFFAWFLVIQRKMNCLAIDWPCPVGIRDWTCSPIHLALTDHLPMTKEDTPLWMNSISLKSLVKEALERFDLQLVYCLLFMICDFFICIEKQFPLLSLNSDSDGDNLLWLIIVLPGINCVPQTLKAFQLLWALSLYSLCLSLFSLSDLGALHPLLCYKAYIFLWNQELPMEFPGQTLCKLPCIIKWWWSNGAAATRLSS